MAAPLTGLRVLELARILAGPWIGQTLADLGADVVKVEAPEGDDTRRWGPPFIERGDRGATGAQRRKSHEAPPARRGAAEGIPRSANGATWGDGSAREAAYFHCCNRG